MSNYTLNGLMKQMEDVYAFVSLCSEEMSRPRDYGTGAVLNMVEVHTLAMIVQQPGLTVTDVSKMWGRTISAASRNVDRLQRKGYIEKRKLPGNKKNLHLYPTPAGEELAALHAAYDRSTTQAYVEKALSVHFWDEFETFFAVLNTFYTIVKEDSQHEL